MFPCEDSKTVSVSTCTYMLTSGMHRRPFEGRHLVGYDLSFTTMYRYELISYVYVDYFSFNLISLFSIISSFLVTTQLISFGFGVTFF